MRKLASIQLISEVKDIKDADFISAYKINGWWVVDQKNKYKVDDYIIYCEVDSWIPHDLAPFLSKGNEPKKYNEVLGNRLRTVKLKGQISQGLLLELDSIYKDGISLLDYPAILGSDVSEILGIQKWEAPSTFKSADARGSFPSFIPKTDQERIQNLSSWLEESKNLPISWEVTEKLDGSSMTVFYNQGETGVCSRNLLLKESDTNTFCTTEKKYSIIEALTVHGKNLAIQGELCGEGIQGNKYSITGHKFFVYDIFDIDKQEYLSPIDRDALCFKFNLLHTPVVYPFYSFNKETSVDQLLDFAEERSILNHSQEREGVVFKCNETRLSFKVISNKWLLKNKD